MDENGGGAGRFVGAFATGDRAEADETAVACDPENQSGPRCIEVPFFVAPGNGEHAWQPTSACGAPLWMKMVAARADFLEPSRRAIVLRLTKLRWLATPSGSPARAA